MCGFSIQRDGHVIRFWVILHQNILEWPTKKFYQRFLVMNFPRTQKNCQTRNKHFQVSDFMTKRLTDQIFNKHLKRDGNVPVSMENGAENHSWIGNVFSLSLTLSTLDSRAWKHLFLFTLRITLDFTWTSGYWPSIAIYSVLSHLPLNSENLPSARRHFPSVLRHLSSNSMNLPQLHCI